MICKNCIHFKVCKHKSKTVYECEHFKEEEKELKTAVKQLICEYERAKRLEWVQNPLAYALYQVWKVADERKINK
jgi:hypothetical protein